MKRYATCFFLILPFVAMNMPAVRSQSKHDIKKRVFITGDAGNSRDSATIFINFLSDVYGAYGNENVSDAAILQEHARNKKLSATQFLRNGKFHFEWQDISRPKFAVIYSTSIKGGLIFKFIIESGDCVAITMKNGQLHFSGNNSAKYNCSYQMQEQLYLASQKEDGYRGRHENLVEWFKYLDSCALAGFKILDRYKNQISASNYQLIKCSVIAAYQQMKLTNLEIYGKYYFQQSNIAESVLQYNCSVWNSKVATQFKKDPIVNHSLEYLDFVEDAYRMDSCLLKNAPYSVTNYFAFVVKNYRGPVREWLIYNLIKKNIHKGGDIRFCLTHSIQAGYIENLSIKKYLSTIENLVPGSIAFEFSLPDTAGNIVHQSTFKGKVILIDTWHEGCGACVAIHPLVDSIKRLFNVTNFEVISIGRGGLVAGKQQWLRLIRGGKYTSTNNINLYMDEKKSATFLKHYQISADPTLILIDKKGKIIETPNDPRGDNGRSLIALIKKNI